MSKKEDAWKQFAKQSGLTDLAYSANSKTVWDTAWDAAYTDGYNQAKWENRAVGYDELPSSPSPYTHVQYGYRFIAHPDGTLTVTPTGTNKK